MYRARDPAGREVAIEQLDARSGDPAAAERVLRQATLRVEHPNVVRTLGSGVDAHGQPYLVTELLEGETLRACFARGIAPGELVDAVRQAALGLAALHARGWAHRDIRPENLFRARGGTLKILDLGAAASTDPTEEPSGPDGFVGTPAYLAPEQQSGGSRKVDGRVDLWALGIVLYEGLTGFSPFARDGVLATSLAVTLDPLPEVERFAPDVPRALVDVVERCLEKSPQQRWASATELVVALEHAARALDASALGDTSPDAVSDTLLDASLAEARRSAPERRHSEAANESARTIDERSRAPLTAVVESGQAPTIATLRGRRALGVGVAVSLLAAAIALASGALESSDAPVRAAPSGSAVVDASVVDAATLVSPRPELPAVRREIVSEAVRREIVSEPPGATVWVGGREVGTTPWSVEVGAEPIAIELRLRGYRREVISASGGSSAPIRVVLRRAHEAPALAPR